MIWPVDFEIPGDPVAWKSSYTFRNKHTGKVHSKKNEVLAHYQDRVQEAARRAMNGQEPFTGPVALVVRCYYTMPKSRGSSSKDRTRWKPKERKTTRPDLSNVIKALEDALAGVVFLDDSQVVEITASKWFAAQGSPGKVAVTVKGVE